MKRFWICLVACLLMAVPALADMVVLQGTVISTQETAVLAPAEGTLGAVLVRSGDAVTEGKEVARLYAQGVYAEQAGTVKLFGSAGDSVETLTSRYGAVAYIEPECQYTISASTRTAYDRIENKIIHPGETVYFECVSGDKHEGKGFVTSVTENGFAIEVTQGEFVKNESVTIYRDSNMNNKSRIGKGTVSHKAPVACTGSGSVANVYVKDGEHVEAGTLLYDTLELEAFCGRITAPAAGAVASVAVSAGTAVERGTLIATLYPFDAMRVAVEAEEADLKGIRVGMNAEMTFANGARTSGEVERISWMKQETETAEDEEETDPAFLVYITLDEPEGVAYGMTTKVAFCE